MKTVIRTIEVTVTIDGDKHTVSKTDTDFSESVKEAVEDGIIADTVSNIIEWCTSE